MKVLSYTLAVCAFFISAVAITMMKHATERADAAEARAAVLTDRVDGQLETISDLTLLVTDLSSQMDVMLNTTGKVVRNQGDLVRLYKSLESRISGPDRSLVSYGG